MNYTKGEWHKKSMGGQIIVDDNGLMIARITPRKNKEAEEANAQLIAAAPDMYEALAVIRELAGGLVNNPLTEDEITNSHEEIFELARQALAKIEREK